MPASVDFYVLAGAEARSHDVFFCRLVHKAWRQGHAVYVHAADAERAEVFDDLLWTYHDISFVPHARAWQDDPGTAPVCVGYADEHAPHDDLLLNLAATVPGCAARFRRIVESAGFDDATRGAARARYRRYQEHGCALKTHQVPG
jgi:DNA polymerase-3 subunit chi